MPPRRSLVVLLAASLILYCLISLSSSSSQPPPPPPQPAPPPPPAAHLPPPPPTHLTTFEPSTRPHALQGYNVFSHLYLSHGKLLFASGPPPPASAAGKSKVGKAKGDSGGRAPSAANESGPFERADVLSGPVELADARFERIDDGKGWFDGLSGQKGVRVIRGSTILLNDEPGPEGFMVYPSHFLPELLLPALKALSLALDPPAEGVPRRVWIPRANDGAGLDGWEDPQGQNRAYVRQFLGPSVELASKAAWDALAQTGETVVFERVVVVDRWAAHRHPSTGKWQKMHAALADDDALAASAADWFAPYRDNARLAAGLTASPPAEAKGDKPVVVYLDRNRPSLTPRLSTSSHDLLLSSLRSFATQAEVHQTVPSRLSALERATLFGRADVVLGVRDERFVEEVGVWMGGGAVVMEVFGKESLVRDSAIVSDMLGLTHLAVHPTRLIDRAAWLTNPPTRGSDWDSTELTVDGQLVGRKVRDILGIE